VAEPIIGPYSIHPPTCVEYDPRMASVAQRINKLITAELPAVRVEHIGSTAVPGCAGKGIVDLMVLYPPGELEATKEVLQTLGFQRQTVGHLFPESRPMRVGALEHQGKRFRVHAHVIAADAEEVEALRTFRERLRADLELRSAYVAQKREIVAAGVTEPALYTRIKSQFIQQVLSSS
jgi:GrpB-like predicted nucleotidyltransferase (UPF0157 family)